VYALAQNRHFTVALRRKRSPVTSAKDPPLKRKTRFDSAALAVLVAICFALPALAVEQGQLAGKAPEPAEAANYSPYVNQTFPNRVLWGCVPISILASPPTPD
jgi:hypothetical protein